MTWFRMTFVCHGLIFHSLLYSDMPAENDKRDPRELLILAKKGDRQAYGALYEIYLTPVYRFIFFRVRGRDEAEDLTQTVFLKVFQSLENFQLGSTSPLAYFLTVARNAVIDFWRKKKEARLDDETEFFQNLAGGEDASRSLELAEAGATVRRFLALLDEEGREILTLRFLSELSHAEIASVIGKSEEAIRQIQCRALKKIREKLSGSPS